MNPKTFLPMALFASLVFSAAPAQEPPAAQPEPRTPHLSRNQLVLRYYPVKGATGREVQEVLSAAQQAFGRELLTEDGSRRNLFPVGRSIAILETPDRVDPILQALPEIEAAAVGSQRAGPEPLECDILRLKYAYAGELASVLRILQREVPDVGGEGKVPNITFLPQQNAIVVRDDPKTVQAIRKLVSSLDVAMDPKKPSGALTLSCQVLRAMAEEPKARPAIPAELLDNLRRLGPWTNFDLLGSGMVRLSAPPGEAEVVMDLGPEYQAILRFQQVAQTAGSPVVTIGRCDLDIRPVPAEGRAPAGPGTKISTSTGVTLGEYTVIGAAGRQPFLLVLKVTE